ncbi:TIGR03032 family protein [Wenzhouxiangella limi]|uniref:TIGR03032 family protein n=1 Tax=Wenzhouxiangella limi TaxID=2707351 RepID=UPI001EF313D9|nr:TIGR03032 family protein [Wenzhouxiangella limi]
MTYKVEGAALEEGLAKRNAESRCGLVVVDLDTGRVEEAENTFSVTRSSRQPSRSSR